MSIASVGTISVAEYHRMIAAGVLTEDDKVELLEGRIVAKMSQTPAHAAIISLTINEVLAPRLPDGWFCRGQCAVTTDDSVPEPDVAVVRGGRRDYLARYPNSSEATLVVEVADSSLEHDRTFKSRIYAAGAIPTYWIVNLRDSQVEVYTDPTGPDPVPAYRRRRDLKGQDAVEILVDGHVIGHVLASDLLP